MASLPIFSASNRCRGLLHSYELQRAQRYSALALSPDASAGSGSEALEASGCHWDLKKYLEISGEFINISTEFTDQFFWC